MVGVRSITLFTLIGFATSYAADWPQWRGIKRDGISPETGLLDAWPTAGPPLVWKATGLGEGYAAFSIAGNRLYTQGQRGDQEFVVAFDTDTGKQIWLTPGGRAFRESRGHGPRGTPTIDGNRLFALAADGMLLCLDTATGRRIWGMNVVEKFGGEVPNWGISESPLVDGDRLIVAPGGRGAGVVALNKNDGSLLWKSQDDSAAYSSAMPFDLGGRRHIAVFTAEAAIGLDIASGELNWRYGRVSNSTANIATPIFHNGHVFYSSAYGTGAALLKLAPVNRKLSATEVYFTRDMKNHYSSSVLVGEHLYGYNDAILTAMKFMTGEVAWRTRNIPKGSVTYADKHLYVFSEEGDMALVEAVPEGYKEKSRFSISRGRFPTWVPPVIANGRLYLREQDNLYCYNIKK